MQWQGNAWHHKPPQQEVPAPSQEGTAPAELLPTGTVARRRSGSRKRRSGLLGGTVRVHGLGAPWRRREKKGAALADWAPAPSPSPAASECGGRVCGFFSQGAEKGPAAPGELGDIVCGFSRWRTEGEKEVAKLQERIDDMWLDEVMFGCDTELFGRVRHAAAELEAGHLLPAAAARRAAGAAEETEADALQSIRARLAARDCVRLQGGATGLDERVRRWRREASEAVRPYLERLAQPGGAQEVRNAMDRLVKEAQEEYASMNAMKTAKSEVVLELQDRLRRQLTLQLALAVELLEASPLFMDVVPVLDAGYFFTEGLGRCTPQDPLRKRTVRCLEVLQQWGTAAARALAGLRRVDGREEEEDTDTGATGQPFEAPALQHAATECGIANEQPQQTQQQQAQPCPQPELHLSRAQLPQQRQAQQPEQAEQPQQLEQQRPQQPQQPLQERQPREPDQQQPQEQQRELELEYEREHELQQRPGWAARLPHQNLAFRGPAAAKDWPSVQVSGTLSANDEETSSSEEESEEGVESEDEEQAAAA